jgi:hypothetical protein
MWIRSSYPSLRHQPPCQQQVFAHEPAKLSSVNEQSHQDNVKRKHYKALTVAQQLPSDFGICDFEGWSRELHFALQESASSHDRIFSANEIPKILQPFSTVLSLFDSCSAPLAGECIFSAPVHSSIAWPETR